MSIITLSDFYSDYNIHNDIRITAVIMMMTTIAMMINNNT